MSPKRRAILKKLSDELDEAQEIYFAKKAELFSVLTAKDSEFEKVSFDQTQQLTNDSGRSFLTLVSLPQEADQ